jgi:hypothetical protein
MTPSGIDPATFRFVAQCLNHCATACPHRKLQEMFKLSPASLQTFIDTPNSVLEDRVQYSTVHIPNAFCDGHLEIISCVFKIFLPVFVL